MLRERKYARAFAQCGHQAVVYITIAVSGGAATGRLIVSRFAVDAPGETDGVEDAARGASGFQSFGGSVVSCGLPSASRQR